MDAMANVQQYQIVGKYIRRYVTSTLPLVYTKTGCINAFICVPDNT